MFIEVEYAFLKSAVHARGDPKQLEFFEADTIPDQQLIETKLTDLGLPFDKNTISISVSERYKDADSMRQSGTRVTKL